MRGAEGVAHLGAVEGDAHDRQVADPGAVGVAYAAAVVGDVGEVAGEVPGGARSVGETVDLAPVGGIEDLRDAVRYRVR